MAVKKAVVPMEALLVGRLPEGKQWRYEPKWDGFRCLAYKRGTTITLWSKSGNPLERYFPDIVSSLEKIGAKNFVLDGELLVGGNNGYSFRIFSCGYTRRRVGLNSLFRNNTQLL